MKVGDLVKNRYNGVVGVVMGRYMEANGPCPVWLVLAPGENGRSVQKYQEYQVEVINESR